MFTRELSEEKWWMRKINLCKQRGVEIVRIRGSGRFYRQLCYDRKRLLQYHLHLTFFLKQKGAYFYIEECVLPVQCYFEDGEIIKHKICSFKQDNNQQQDTPAFKESNILSYNKRFSYDRRSAVQYAERWWNSYNPSFHRFSVDCTNYVSQCLLAGGAPMRGVPDRSHGWWYKDNNWSYSWAVAHSLRWYLSGSTEGLKGKEIESADQLKPGDIICYDFSGDGRWDHTTIVVSKDANNMPLVNAHTDNSRHRYWSYEDSTAWTPYIQYKFFQIGHS